MYKTEIIGFDAREMWLDVDSQWTQKRWNLWQNKDEILLRLDILKPFSVDSIVWHSVFSEMDDPRLWLTVDRKPEYSGTVWDDIFSESRKLSRPDTIYAPVGAWRNLGEMQHYLQKSWGATWKPCYLVAIIEVIYEEDDIEEENEFTNLQPISPSIVDNQWRLLGYDVADSDLITGLFDPIMDLNEAAKLRYDWKDYLNEYHLFIEPEKAFDYIAVANLRKPTHIPYYVYALYGIQEIRPNLEMERNTGES